MLYPKITFHVQSATRNEKPSFGIPFVGLTAASYDAFVGATLPALRAAIEAITLGDVMGTEIVGVVYQDVGTLPNEPFAQREIKGRFTFIDVSNNRPMSVSIPAIDLDNVSQFGTDVLDISGNAFILAFQAAVELHARSPYGNNVSIQSGKLVGVNN